MFSNVCNIGYFFIPPKGKRFAVATLSGNLTVAVIVLFTFGIMQANTADAAIIAQWKFEKDDPATPENEFLLDSSGNGNTLINFGAASATDYDPHLPERGVATFNGDDWMRTANKLDLSLYNNIRISWWQKVGSGNYGVVWEHPESLVENPGGIVANVNGSVQGTGYTGVWGNPSVNQGAEDDRNIDFYPHSSNGTLWEHVAVSINLNETNGENVVRVFSNGNLTGSASHLQSPNTPTNFLDDVLYIGARGGNEHHFTGSIGGLIVEENPASFTLPPIKHNAVKVYIMAGQSNMLGAYTNIENLPPELKGEQSDVVVFSNDQWSTLQPGICAASRTDFGPEITFGRTMADHLSDKAESVILVKCAVPATTLADNWNPTTPGPLYTRMVNAVKEAVNTLSENHTVEIAGMLWMQGESDAMVVSKANAYATNFRNLVQKVRTDLETPNLPIAVGQIASNETWVNYEIVQQAVTYVVNEDPNVVAFSTDSLPTTNGHYNTQGQIQLGNLFADALLRVNTIPGDANNDGKVDGSDVTILAGNWQVGVGVPEVTATWVMGDFNSDGQIDGSDVTILAGNWQYGVAQVANAVPEPSMSAWLTVHTIALVCYTFKMKLSNKNLNLSAIQRLHRTTIK